MTHCNTLQHMQVLIAFVREVHEIAVKLNVGNAGLVFQVCVAVCCGVLQCVAMRCNVL